MEIKEKICIITGATSGIGRETALELARAGAVLILPIRDSLKGDILKDEILEQTPHAKLDFMHCDLASFASIREFATAFKKKYKQLHILINNAGIWETKRNLTEDGIERNFAVNHLAPFLLTNLLLETLKGSAPARIVNVASDAHKQGKINFTDLEYEKKFSSLGSYAQSKLANILFTKKLSQKLKGTGVTANCLHPGVVSTNLFDKMPNLLMSIMSLFMISPRKGAQTTLYLATSPQVENVSGEYFAKSKSKKPAPQALRQDVADRLWEISEKYVGIQS
ncbi:MAG: SDR family oxidoreductase [Bacteroidetes bacterium]|nr:MAG: SDR family oxidoreductase [Bacteroidota bacterium]